MVINSTQIQSFLAVAKEQNFTKAAEKLYISQPVLSRKISTMEQELGLTLFERTKHGVFLTHAGEKLQEFFEKSVNDFNSILGELIEDDENTKKQLHIGMFEGFDLSDFLQSLMFEFTRDYNEYSITFASGREEQLLEGLNNGLYDLVIILQPSSDIFQNDKFKEKYELQELFNVQKCLLYSDRNPIAKQNTITFNDFKNQTLLCLQENSQVTYDVVTNHSFFETLDWNPNVQMYPSIDSVSMALIAGMGYAIMDDSTRIFHNKSIHHIMLDENNTACLVTKKESDEKVTLLKNYIYERYNII
ncbi:MAG: LysR family transcriptional regulator [Erysipelotrichaceae bacterium]|nr:LysR family transcriptional regulator [Erysipelotrichaceae bacterium]